MKVLHTLLPILGLTVVLFFRSEASYSPVFPPGVIIETASNGCPPKTISADGSSLLRSGKYASLFTAIGVTYGSADGTHFNIPNTQAVFLRGAGSQTISGITYSASQGTTQGDLMQGHFHSFPVAVTVSESTGQPYAATGTQSIGGIATGGPVSDGANGTPRVGAETRPANITVLNCIYY